MNAPRRTVPADAESSHDEGADEHSLKESESRQRAFREARVFALTCLSVWLQLLSWSWLAELNDAEKDPVSSVPQLCDRDADALALPQSVDDDTQLALMESHPRDNAQSL